MNYPRSLYLKGWEDLSLTVIVHSEDEELAARANGYKNLKETPLDAPVAGDDIAVIQPDEFVEKAPTGDMTEDDRLDIATSSESASDLAAKYGVSVQKIGAIRRWSNK